MAQQLAHDDVEAWHGLTALRPAIVAVARHVLGFGASAAEVDDCVAEVFRRVFEGRDRPSATIPLRPWALGIARHVCLDARRVQRRARARTEDPALLEAIADEAPGAQHQLELAERTRRLQTALDALPHEQRRAVLMHAEGHGYREIGETMSVPIGTICTWISRARRGLAGALSHGELEERA
jgi:RNA polymerase sigma factor (sigma-70 family)